MVAVKKISWDDIKRFVKINRHTAHEAPQAASHFVEQHSGEIENNPYLQSRALWIDIYGAAEDRYRKSRALNVKLTVLVGMCILGLINIGSKSKIIPYVVEVQNGQVLYGDMAKSSNADSMRLSLSKYFMQQFITNARAVSVDGYIQRHQMQTAFSMTKGAATTLLTEYYRARDPYKLVADSTISIQINYVNSLPNHAFRIGWTEEIRSSESGILTGEEHYIGEFDYQWGEPSQQELILQNNPFGFYITNISWAGVK